MSIIVLSRTSWAAAACCISILSLAGCSNSPSSLQRASYTTSLNKYYEGRPMCIWPDSVKFPVVDASPDQIGERGLNALADAGLLARKPGSEGSAAGSYTFELTREGRSAIDPDVFAKDSGNFCYGRRQVSSVDSARENSRSTDLVRYHYTVAEPAAWASDESVQRAFPQIAGELSGPHQAKAILLNTTAGWQVSGTPATTGPIITARPPAVATGKIPVSPAANQGS